MPTQPFLTEYQTSLKPNTQLTLPRSRTFFCSGLVDILQGFQMSGKKIMLRGKSWNSEFREFPSLNSSKAKKFISRLLQILLRSAVDNNHLLK